ncbi:hypothetical protein [Caldimonas sp. KR1-144]|uniref:hypothetical protein n=1 Tax=Caldimonas sp. KR1-144 TaxID=3400911 RepID=UPI003C092D45
MYALNTDQARKADQHGSVIHETGKYIGTFTRAEDVKASSGTQGIDFSFVSRDGQKARFALYTKKSDGTVISIGFGFVMALMTCLKLRDIKPQTVRVKKWDSTANAEIDVDASCFPDLMNKPIGVLLEAEEYEKKGGGIGTRMVLAGVFQADTELTASEILDKKVKPEQLSRLVSRLRDRPIKTSKSSTKPASNGQGGGGGSSFDDMDDDIPFVTASPAFDMAAPSARRMSRYA